MSEAQFVPNLEEYEDLTIELYYPEEVSPELREILKQDLGDNYRDKYTYRLPASKPDPIMAIDRDGKLNTLLGDEITGKNIKELLTD